MKKARKVTTLLLFVCIIIFVGYFITKTKVALVGEHQQTKSQEFSEKGESFSEKPTNPTFNDDGSVTLPEGYISYGFYDLASGKIIDDGTTIEIYGDILQGRVSFHQNFPVEKSYLIIILIDYLQHEFYVGDQSFQTYSYQLEGENEINLDISVHLGELEGIEFSFIIVPEPKDKSYLIDGEYDWNTMFSDRELMVSRYNLHRSSLQLEPVAEFSQNFMEFRAEGKVNGFELVKSKESLMVSVEGKSGETLELIMLNQAENSKEKEYVIMGFAGWEQVPIDGEHMRYYVTVPMDTSISIPVVLPEVETPTTFQIIALSEPNMLLDRYSWHNPTTLRVLVEP